MNRQGRPTVPTSSEAASGITTFSGDRGLEHEEPLSFEQGSAGRSGVEIGRAHV